MMFDKPTHSNSDVPLYFWKKIYAECVLGKHVNYFDMRRNQGIGHGSVQNRPGAWVNPGRPAHPAPLIPPPTPSIPILTFHQAVVTALGALRQVTQTLTEQATHVAASISDRSDHAGDSTDHAVPHFCQSCGSICVAPSPSDHGIVSYTKMMSMPDDIDFAEREVKLSFFSVLNACNLSNSKLNSKNQVIYSFY